jgi:lipid A ethanolaminephosphotransferase
MIEYLESLDAKFDTVLLYVSDHGESLGENGIYLHGFPYVLAPVSQTRVPMLFWASEAYYERSGVDRGCLEARSLEPYSHDVIFHTAIGLIEAQGDGYRSDLDVLAACRRTQLLSMVNQGEPQREVIRNPHLQ